MRDKYLLKRILVSTLILIILFNFIIPTSVPFVNTVYAKTITELTPEQISAIQQKMKELAEKDAEDEGYRAGKDGTSKKDGKERNSKPKSSEFAAIYAEEFDFLEPTDKFGSQLWNTLISSYNTTYTAKYEVAYENGKSDTEREEREEEEWNNKTKLTEDELATLIADAKEAGRTAGAENGYGDGENGDKDNRSNYDLPDEWFGSDYGFLPDGTELSGSDLSAIKKAYKDAFDLSYKTSWNNGYQKYLDEDGEDIYELYPDEELEDPNAPGPGNQGGSGGSGGAGTTTNPGTGDNTNPGETTNPENPGETTDPNNPSNPENPGDSNPSEDGEEGDEVFSERQEKLDALLAAHSNGPGTALLSAIWNGTVQIFASIQELVFAVASSGGLNTEDVTSYITPLDIFFNKFTLTDINIFSDETANGTQLDSDGLVYKLRHSAAFWYYIFRSIAIGALLISFVLNAIKALSSGSTIEQKAIAKMALKDWVISAVLVFFMHMLIIFIINLNNSFVAVLENVSGSAEIGELMETMLEACFSSSFIIRCAALIVYVLMIWQTVKYLLIYIERFLKAFFLMVISPIIPVWYSTEKAIGNRSVALDGWLKAFIYLVFIQLIHCVIYIVIVAVAMTSLGSNTTDHIQLTDIGAALFAVLALFTVPYGESWLKKILGFENSMFSQSIIQNAYNYVRSGEFSRAVSRTAEGVGKIAGVGVQFGKNVGNTLMHPVDTANKLGDGVVHFKNKATDFKNEAKEAVHVFADKVRGGREDYVDSEVNQILNDGKDYEENKGDSPSDSGGVAILAAGLPSEGSESKEEKEANEKTQKIVKEKTDELKKTVNDIKKTKTVDETESKEKHTNETEDTEIHNIIVGGDAELLDAFKQAFSKLQEDNKQVQSWGEEINSKLDELDGLRDLLSNEEAGKIERDIDGMNSPEERKAYVNALGKDTLQGQYADKYADWKIYEELDDEVVNNKRNLINEYREKGLRIDDNLASALTTSEGAKLIGNLVSSEDEKEADKIVENIDDIKTEEGLEQKLEEIEKINERIANDSVNSSMRLYEISSAIEGYLDALVARDMANRKDFTGSRSQIHRLEDNVRDSKTKLNDYQIDKKVLRSALEEWKQIPSKGATQDQINSLRDAVFSKNFSNLPEIQKELKKMSELNKSAKEYQTQIDTINKKLTQIKNAKVTVNTKVETSTTTTTTTVKETRVTGPTESSAKVINNIKNDPNFKRNIG